MRESPAGPGETAGDAAAIGRAGPLDAADAADEATARDADGRGAAGGPSGQDDLGEAGGSRGRDRARRRPLRIGLTGPIGCGKSTIARWLAEWGARVVDADAVARSVTDPGEPAFEAVVRRFGAEVVAADGSLDRAALARIVFSDPAALRDLEAIVHPAVRPRIVGAIEAAADARAPAVVVEAIKLVEGGLAELCDEVWLVVCDPAVQRRRLLERGSDADDVERRIAAQGDLAARLRPAATRVIDTSGSMAGTRRIVRAAYDAALRATT